MNFLAEALASVGNFFAQFGSVACICWAADEPTCPKSLIK